MKSLFSRFFGRPGRRERRGQSLVEVTLFLPLLLMMLAGLIEFGFALNQYLNTLDAAREAARFSSDGDPLFRAACGDNDDDDISDGDLLADDGCGGADDPAVAGAYSLVDDTIIWPAGSVPPGDVVPGDPYCGTTDFYMQTACVALQTVSPVPLDPARDDVVVSVFRVLSGTVVARWPNCMPDVNFDCVNDPPTGTETLGEWHLYGYGDQCANREDDDADGEVDDGCLGGPPVIGSPEDSCDTALDNCHPSRLSTNDVEGRLDPGAPNTAVLLVEIFFSYNQILKLPWLAPFVPDPVEMHTYTIVPLPAAEPTLTITGTVMEDVGGTLVPIKGVTIDFGEEGIAITDDDGLYVKGGFNSGTYHLVPQPYFTCTYTPAFLDVTLTTQDSGDNNFVAVCPPPTATPTLTPTPTATNTPNGTATPTPSPTVTLTPGPGCDPTGILDPSKSSMLIEFGVTQLTADNIISATVIVTLMDTCDAPMPAGTLVTLVSSRGVVDTILPSATQGVNAGGQAFFNIRSGTASPYVSGAYQPSVFTDTSGVVPIGTVDMPFVCVRGAEDAPAGSQNLTYLFTNDTAESRQLSSLTLSALPLIDPSRHLIQIDMFPAAIWTGSQTGAVITINGGWTVASRTIASVASRFLGLNFDFDVTIPGEINEYVLQTQWQDIANAASVCTSAPVVVTRGP
jgi:hypothetical protein